MEKVGYKQKINEIAHLRNEDGEYWNTTRMSIIKNSGSLDKI